MLHRNDTALARQQTAPRTAVGGYRLVTEAFETRIEEVEVPVDAPDYVTTFPPGIGGYIAAHDEAIAYLEDVIADCLETLKELKDSRWINAMELSEPAERRG